jgi:hypothetical protein
MKPDHEKDDSSESEDICYLILFCIYVPCLGLTARKLYKYRNETRVVRTIYGITVLFFLSNLHTVRSVYWADPLLDLPIVVYNLLEVTPNILLYIIGQIIAYLW